MTTAQDLKRAAGNAADWMRLEYEPGLVSVIIPTYNRAHLLPDAMDSVWKQTYRPIEMIVVDDGSTDETSVVVSQWGTRREGNNRFHLNYVYQPNHGVCAARNRGLLESCGEFIQYLDSDDLLLPSKFSRQVKLLRNNLLMDYTWALTQKVGPNGPFGVEGAPMDPDNPQDSVASYNWTVLGPMYRRQVCVAVGPWAPELRQSNDLWQEAKVKCLGFKGEFVDEVLAVWRFHEGPRVTRSGARVSALSSEMVALKILAFMQECGVESLAARRVVCRYLIRAGLVLGAEGDSEGRRRCLREARRVPCGWFRSTACLAAVVASVLPNRPVYTLGHAVARSLRLIRHP